MTAPRKRGDRVAHRVELAGQTVAGGVGSAFGAAKLRDAYKDEHADKLRQTIRTNAVRAHRLGVSDEKIVRGAQLAHSGKPPFKALMVATGAGGTAAAAHHYRQLHDWSRRRQAQLSGLTKSAPRRAPGVKAKVRVKVTPPAKHTTRPYVGQHRAMSLTDNLRATAMLHSKHLVNATEAIGDFFKAWCPKCAEMVPGEARYAHVPGIGRVQILGHHEGGIVHVLDRSDQGRLVHRDKLNVTRQKGTGMAKSAFGVDMAVLADLDDSEDVSKGHMLRDTLGLGAAAGAGALLAKPALAKPLGAMAGKAVKAVKPRLMPGVSKSAGSDAAEALKTLKFKKPAPGVKPSGPGSERAKMDPRAWETQTAAARRGVQKSLGPDELLKASAFGHRGDKRNTKYAGAAYGGAAVGGAVGRQVATRTAGTTVRDVNALGRTHMNDMAPTVFERNAHHMEGALGGGPKNAFKSGFKFGRANTKDLIGTIKDVPGGARMLRGGKAGAAGGAVAGVGALAAHRHNNRVKLGKAATKKQAKPSAGRVAAGTAFSGFHGAVAGKKGKKLSATGSEVGHSIGGSVIGAIPGAVLRKPALATGGGYAGGYGGAAAGVYSNQRKGRYKRES